MTDEFTQRAKELLDEKLSNHPDEGVRAIHALVGEYPDDDPSVVAIAAALRRKAGQNVN